MIELVLAHADLGQVRFAHSPVREVVASLRTLHDSQPRRRQAYQRWLTWVDGRLDGLDLELLAALAPAGSLTYDFLAPDLTGQWGELEEELAAIAATPAATVRHELELVAQGGPIPDALGPLYKDPAAGMPVVAAEMRRYWQVAIEPIWPQLRSLVIADLFYRMEQFASGGVATVLGRLHPEITFKDDRVYINKPHHCVQRYDMSGAGILLVPCALSWPDLEAGCCRASQPSLCYPPRGVAELGGDVQEDNSDPLGALVGRTRAALLVLLEGPQTTTHLARELDMSAAAVSQHLQILKATGLASSRRRGRLVYYQRTAAATALLSTAQPDRCAC